MAEPGTDGIEGEMIIVPRAYGDRSMLRTWIGLNGVHWLSVDTRRAVC